MATLNQAVSVGVALLLIYVSYKYFYSSVDIESSNPNAASSRAATPAHSSTANTVTNERDLVEVMAANNKRVAVFYGSQTGTAEDLAHKLSKELSAKFGLKTMTADPDAFDFENLNEVPAENLLVFLMASYGEGEPTDNAQEFMTFLTSAPEFSQGETELPNLQYAVFGLGSTSYDKFNQVGRDLQASLTKLRAQSIGEYGEGDDGKGTLEEDFMAWKDQFFEALTREWQLTEREAVYEPSLEVREVADLMADSPNVYLGEPNLKHLVASKSGEVVKGPFTSSNPLLATVTNAYKLFKPRASAAATGEKRECVHIELDTTGIRYQTGDHVAVWAQNSELETTRFLTAVGLAEKRDSVIKIGVLDSTSAVRIPSPTTYDTVVRNWLEINGPVSRQVLAAIAPYAPTPAVKAATQQLAGDKNTFHDKVVRPCYNLARLMLDLSQGQPWKDVPFSFVIETVPHLSPRYYSISSSALETPNKITITAVVERQRPKEADHEVWGVVTNNLLDLEEFMNHQTPPQYALERPRRASATAPGLRLPVHVRHSLFKLPRKSDLPIIMIGPGTGVAPFRGFVRERAAQAKQGLPVGKSLLFFGARHRESEFLYEEEWPLHSSWLEVETAFSRDGEQRVYVQDRLRARAADISALIDQGASFYVCGDASRMAREVSETLRDIIAAERSVSVAEADKILRKLRSRNKYQEDVW